MLIDAELKFVERR